jgi:uncharacterized repeat protein (TIGR01451 family)
MTYAHPPLSPFTASNLDSSVTGQSVYPKGTSVNLHLSSNNDNADSQPSCVAVISAKTITIHLAHIRLSCAAEPPSSNQNQQPPSSNQNQQPPSSNQNQQPPSSNQNQQPPSYDPTTTAKGSVKKAHNILNSVATSPLLSIDKDISNDNFSWTDTVQIKISVKNEGNGTAHDIFLTDYYPAGFEILKNQGLFVDENTITYNKTALPAGESYAISYSMSGKEGMSGNVQISLLPVSVVYSDYAGDQFLAKSDQLKITLHSSLSMADTDSRIALLLTIAFLFGGFGALIHWLTMTAREKKLIEGRTANRHFLLGGMAGVIVLGTLEGLSQLFSNDQFKLLAQNMILLITTCFAAGYVPDYVINKATQKWRDEAGEASETAKKTKRGLDSSQKLYDSLQRGNQRNEEAIRKELTEKEKITTSGANISARCEAEKEGLITKIKELQTRIDQLSGIEKKKSQ